MRSEWRAMLCASADDSEGHWEDKHSGGKYLCPATGCGKTYADFERMKLHIIKYHRDANFVGWDASRFRRVE